MFLTICEPAVSWRAVALREFSRVMTVHSFSVELGKNGVNCYSQVVQSLGEAIHGL